MSKVGCLFITGTGTDMGKTYVSGLILKKFHQCGLSAGYYKAAMSGNERRSDGSLIPGDAVMVKHSVTGENALISLAGPANNRAGSSRTISAAATAGMRAARAAP